MVLVDTSVWVAHLRHGGVGLEALLTEGRVLGHPLIVGELACGNLRHRFEILTYLQALPQAIPAKPEEVLQFIEDHGLLGKGLGYMEMHVLASARLARVALWTLDKKLNNIAGKLRLGPEKVVGEK
jgi:predicted nucleic acid-binding protein